MMLSAKAGYPQVVSASPPMNHEEYIPMCVLILVTSIKLGRPEGIMLTPVSKRLNIPNLGPDSG